MRVAIIIYIAIGELSSRLEEKKNNEPRPKIGFQQNSKE